MSYMIENPSSALQSHISKIIHTSFLNRLFCSDPSEELCHEKKALYKLISGLHSSISVHIAYDYLLDESTNLVCAKNCTHLFVDYWAKFHNCFDHFWCINDHSGDKTFLWCMTVSWSTQSVSKICIWPICLFFERWQRFLSSLFNSFALHTTVKD